MRLIFTRQGGSSLNLMSTITSVPPATTFALSPYFASRETASLIVLGSKYSIIVYLRRFNADLWINGNLKDARLAAIQDLPQRRLDRKSTRLNSSHSQISYHVFCF